MGITGGSPRRDEHGNWFLCAFDGCGRPVLARELCQGHYDRWRKYGDPVGWSRASTREERFWAKVSPGLAPDECWPWQASCTGNGYGMFSSAPGRRGLAHRFAYELLVGPIPEGLELDHLCRNRACVNPAHLEPVTRQENVRRYWDQYRKEKACRGS